MSVLVTEAVTCHGKTASRMCCECHFCGPVWRYLDPDIVAMHMQFRRLVRDPDDLDTLSLRKSNDLIPDKLAILDSNLDPHRRVRRIVRLLLGRQA
jgi:hypothetical protein